MRIKALDGSKPHPDWKGWRGFLKKGTELRREVDGVKFYGNVNCNYILFPDGTLVENFGFWGNVLMDDIELNGAKTVLARLKAKRAEWVKLLKPIIDANRLHSMPSR